MGQLSLIFIAVVVGTESVAPRNLAFALKERKSRLEPVSFFCILKHQTLISQIAAFTWEAVVFLGGQETLLGSYRLFGSSTPLTDILHSKRVEA